MSRCRYEEGHDARCASCRVAVDVRWCDRCLANSRVGRSLTRHRAIRDLTAVTRSALALGRTKGGRRLEGRCRTIAAKALRLVKAVEEIEEMETRKRAEGMRR